MVQEWQVARGKRRHPHRIPSPVTTYRAARSRGRGRICTGTGTGTGTSTSTGSGCTRSSSGSNWWRGSGSRSSRAGTRRGSGSPESVIAVIVSVVDNTLFHALLASKLILHCCSCRLRVIVIIVVVDHRVRI